MKAPLLLAAVAFVLAACGRREAPQMAEALPAASVRAEAVQLATHPAREEVVGTVRAKLRAAIEAKVSARIESLLVAPGQPVRTGDVLAQLDAREIQAKLDQALAVREQAVRDLERARTLLAQKISTQAEFDAAQARERVAAGAAKEAETMLGYTKITAPFDGIVTRKLANVGDLAAPGRAIVEVEDPRALRFEADVPEALIANVKAGAAMPVRAGSGPAMEALVAEMAPVADPASRTFLVKLDLPSAPGVRSGQFGRVLVPTGEVSSIRVPAAALVTRGQMEFVVVVAQQRAELRIVRTGKRTGGEIELLSGVSPGERIVVEGAAELRDGQPLVVKP